MNDPVTMVGAATPADAGSSGGGGSRGAPTPVIATSGPAMRVPESSNVPRVNAPAAPAATGAVKEGNFSQTFREALKSVSQAQNQATQMQREVALDNPTVGLEQTMVAMQKAQIGFQAALQVRNRLVQAYSDIMNMQV